MLLANCQIMFSGGPHGGAIISLEYSPRENIVVPADPKWRDFPRRQPSQRSTGLAAAYVRVGTRMTAGPSGHLVVWHYRFLSYCTPFVGERKRRPPQPAESRWNIERSSTADEGQGFLVVEAEAESQRYLWALPRHRECPRRESRWRRLTKVLIPRR